MIDHGERARELFLKGYNCAQAVACAFCDVTGLTMEESARMASSFGGGLGRLREVCGAVSGAAMVLGMAEGYADPKDAQAKKDHYARVRDFAARFREANGSIVCRELLAGGDPHAAQPGGEPEARTPEFYKKRPCPELVGMAVDILDEMLEK
jgi:C_GCAxxG_C_C family probable redox protein